MTTRLFDAMDRMEAVATLLPQLAGKVSVEGTLPVLADLLPVVVIVPRRSRPGGVDGEIQGRENTVMVVVRAAGERPGRKAHELLALLHAAVTTDRDLNSWAQVDLGTESFRYVDSEQSICDLQAEYEITFELARESLLAF